MLSGGNSNIKIGAELYKKGSQYSISKTKVKKEIIDKIQSEIRDDRDYKIKIGAELDYNPAAIKKQLESGIGTVSIKVDAELVIDTAAITRQIQQAVRLARNAALTDTGTTPPPASRQPRAAATAATRQPDAVAVRQLLNDAVAKTQAGGGLSSAEIKKFATEAKKAGAELTATTVTELRKELPSALAKVADDAILGLAKGLVSNESALIDASRQAAESLIKALKKALRIASPSGESKDEVGKPIGEGIGKGTIEGLVQWERRIAGAIRQTIGNAWKQGLARDAAARGALADMGRDAGQIISTSLGKALRQGMASSVAPALKGGLLGGTGGMVTGGLVGGLGAAGVAVKQAVMPSVMAFGSSPLTQKLGMLGQGAASLATGGANDAFNTFLHNSIDSVVQAALSGGGQAGLIGAAGVGGVAAVTGLARGAGGSLVTQAVESIKNRILGAAAEQAQGQMAIPGVTGGAVTAPIQNASNVMGLIQGRLQDAAAALQRFADGLNPGELQQQIRSFLWNLAIADEQFEVIRKQTQQLGFRMETSWNQMTGRVPQQLLPPQPVPGTGMIRQRNMPLGSVVGRTPFGFIGESPDINEGRGYLERSRRELQPFGRPGEWQIVDKANGVWQRILSDSELAQERLALIAQNLTRAGSASYRTWTDRQGVGTFNPFDQAFYRPTRSAQVPPTPRDTQSVRTGPNSFGPDGWRSSYFPDGSGSGPGGTFGGNRFGTPNPGGALALRNVPVEFFTSFRDAERLLAEVDKRLASVAKAFDTLKVKSQLQADQDLRRLNVTLNATIEAFDKGEISATDLSAAMYGLNRQFLGLEGQTAQVQNLAKAFENLGGMSAEARQAIERQRNADVSFIQESTSLGVDEKGNPILSQEGRRAGNLRDVQQLTYANELVRGAQSASGFGGFRGREIGNDTLIKALQRTNLSEYLNQFDELSNNILRTTRNKKVYAEVQAALTEEFDNASRALRVLNGEAKAGETLTQAARNAWGTILDDFQNLVPQLLVFAVAYNLILQRVLATPGAVVQAAAAFDRLETSISSYLSATRGIGDASGELSKIRQVALDLGVGYEKAAKSYLSFAAATQGTTLEGREAEISRTLFTAGRNQGLSGEQLDRAATALTQILSKGRVQAEELRGQLAEQLPGAVQVAARAYGVTTKELYRMVEAGQLAGDEFVDKFINQLVAEGADINQLAGSFSNVTEQLGSSIQMLAASAGEPFLQPLTQSLRLINTVVTGLIPLGAPLVALFSAIGLNALRSALNVKSLRAELANAAITGLNGASGSSPILGADGRPIQRPGRGDQAASGLQRARSGLAQAFDLAGLAKGRTDLEAIGRGAKDVAGGLKQATIAATGLGTGLKAALAPALKLYLAIEGFNLLLKGVTGQLSAINAEMQKSERVRVGNLNGPDQLNIGQRVLSFLNVPKNIENAGTLVDASTIAGNTTEIRKRIEANKKLIQKSATDVLAIDKKIFAERQRLDNAQTNEERDRAKKAIDTLVDERKQVAQELQDKGLSGEGVQAQIAAQKAAIQAQEEVIKRREAVGFNVDDLNAVLESDKENLRLLIEASKQFGEIFKVKSISALEAQLRAVQEVLNREDVNSPRFAEFQLQAAGLQKAISDQQLLPQEQKLMELESTQRLITAQLREQENIAKIKLGLLDNEKRLIESNLDLEKTRTRLRETLANNRVQIAQALNDPEAARNARAEARAVRDDGRRRELGAQLQLIDNDQQKARIETSLQREQINLQKQQLAIEVQLLEIERVKLVEASKVNGISATLFNTYMRILSSVTQTINSVKRQTGQQGELNSLLDQSLANSEAIAENRRRQLGVEGDINSAVSQGEAALDAIEERSGRINAAETYRLSVIKRINDEIDRSTQTTQLDLEVARASLDAYRERLRMAEELAAVEMEAIDRRLEAQKGSFDGGFFERMMKFSLAGNQSEQDAYSLAKRRAELMQQVKDQQDKQKLAELEIKAKEIQAERLLLALKVSQLKLANEETKTRLRASAVRLRMAFENRGDTEGVNSVNQVYGNLGLNPGAGDELSASLYQLQSDVDAAKAADKFAASFEQLNSQVLDAQAQSLRDSVAYTRANIAATSELLKLDAAEWMAKFVDEVTPIGRVLSETIRGLTEFRQSVASGLTEGLLGGNGAEAISNAGRQLASKVLTSIVDETILKPLERNVYQGLAKIFNVGQPASEQQQIASNTAQQLAITAKGNASIDSLKTALDVLDQSVNSGVDKIINALIKSATPFSSSSESLAAPQASAPAGAPQSLAPVVGGIANMLPGTRGGPNINRGVSDNHAGRDLGVDVGDPVHARRAGTVVSYIPSFTRRSARYMGEGLRIKYDDGMQGTYGHIQNPAVKEGDRVEAGQFLAKIFADGQNTHLHYELRDQFGKLLEPLKWINESLRVPAAAPSPAAMTSLPGVGAATPVIPTPLAVVPSTGAAPTLQQAGAMLGTQLPQFDSATGTSWTQLGAAAEQTSQTLTQASAATEQTLTSVTGLGDSLQAASQSVGGVKIAADQMPSAFNRLSTTISGVVGVLGSLGMGFAGAQQVKKGGTYNTLMGLAGIFGSIGSIAGMFGTGGIFAGKPSVSGMSSSSFAVNGIGVAGPNWGIPQRARGGPVMARQPYVVGELGPELFVPSASGTIVPNNQLSAGPYSATAAALGGGGAGAIRPMSNEPIRFESTVINGIEFVTRAEAEEIGRRSEARGAERGTAMTLSRIRNSVKTRKQSGF